MCASPVILAVLNAPVHLSQHAQLVRMLQSRCRLAESCVLILAQATTTATTVMPSAMVAATMPLTVSPAEVPKCPGRVETSVCLLAPPTNTFVFYLLENRNVLIATLNAMAVLEQLTPTAKSAEITPCQQALGLERCVSAVVETATILMPHRTVFRVVETADVAVDLLALSASCVSLRMHPWTEWQQSTV